MNVLKFLDKLFDLTTTVESTVETVSKKTRRTVEKIVSSTITSIKNSLLFALSSLLVLAGLIILLSKYAPVEYVLLFIGLLGFLCLALQKISIKLN